MPEVIKIKKSAFELDAILFALAGIALGAYLNYKARLIADAKLEAKLQEEIDAIKNSTPKT